jgi:TPR repeat protein
MQEYVTSLKDLVYLAIPNRANVRTEADKGNPEACFQYGMIILLCITKACGAPPPPGMNVPLPKIDYALAKKYFGKPCLADNPEAIRMIGFIDELEGDLSSAFQNYAKSVSKNEELTCPNFIDRGINGRYELQTYLNKLGLFPNCGLNEIITSSINDFLNGDDHEKTRIAVEFASICDVEALYYEAAERLYSMGEYLAASQFINKGNIPKDDFLSISVSDKFLESKKTLETVKYTKEHVVDMILHDYADKQIFILASLVQNRKGHYRELFETMRSKGYINMRIDGEFVENIQGLKVDRYISHNIEAVIDELQVSVKNMERLMNSVATASNLGKGNVLILEKDTGASPKLFAVLDIVEIEGNSLLANQWVDSLANVKEQVLRKANEQRGQWESNVHQKINMLVSEKLKVDFEKEQEKKRLEEKKKFRIKLIIFWTVYVLVLIFILFGIKPNNGLEQLIVCGGGTGIYLLIVKLILPNDFKKLVKS